MKKRSGGGEKTVAVFLPIPIARTGRHRGGGERGKLVALGLFSAIRREKDRRNRRTGGGGRTLLYAQKKKGFLKGRRRSKKVECERRGV